ncbi:MAG: hypothetical protein CMJ19_20840 [Phycisphaeraceae bacterium]|nr:hypothetical protein [Phycisphaeraceae bacterium]
MPIHPTPHVSGGCCDIALEHAADCQTHAHHLDHHHHSLAWLDRHCPAAANDLQQQLAKLDMIRQAAIQHKPIDIWLQSSPLDDLEVCSTDEDAYQCRPLLSQSVEQEDDASHDDDALALATLPPVDLQPPQPKLDDRLVPAGIVGIDPPIQRPKREPLPPRHTSPDQASSMKQGWLMRVSMLVLLCLAVEGLIAKWLFS